MKTAALEMSEGFIINSHFREFIENDVLPLCDIDKSQFWPNVMSIIEEFTPINESLLLKRGLFQTQINGWHQQHQGEDYNVAEYQQFLRDIGYLVDEGDDFSIDTENVDAEIAEIAGPQLVVPLSNARFALNAVNARWGSLYDAFYNSDIIPKTGKLKPRERYNALRGEAVIGMAREFLDEHYPLKNGSHRDVTLYQIYYQQLVAVLKDGTYTGLKTPKQFVAYNGSKDSPTELVLEHHGLLAEIDIAPAGNIGRSDIACINDVYIESAITTIMDCEDSVAAVDAEDKIHVYRNWLGLMQGNLSATFEKNGQPYIRQMKLDRMYNCPNGETYPIRRRSVMFVRNVGMLTTIDLIRDHQGRCVHEGILDGIFTALIGMIDIRKEKDHRVANSKKGSIYIVKPKMHGPEEVAFTCQLFSRIEGLLGLPDNTMKLGIMDEERRTTINLKACIRQAKSRCVFINTGFLDRTGDEIHTSMEAGAFLPKDEIKHQPWISAYENRNVSIGLACGLQGRAQIGKGMWPKPDAMSEMMATKSAHLIAGASTSWVPSPTAATLHAIHYHEVDVRAEQCDILNGARSPIDTSVGTTLQLPLLTRELSEHEIEQELANNIQGILGYVVRWVEMGVGCSKVPDINNVGLMEDRATLRISSQHIANWLRHDICTADQVLDLLTSMATVVDRQNKGDPNYIPIGHDLDNSAAFRAAKDLIFSGLSQPNGYTECILNKYRLEAKN